MECACFDSCPSRFSPCAQIGITVATGCLNGWDVGLQMEASLSAHLYTHSLHPDMVLLSFIPLEDLLSRLSGLGFVMSELVFGRDLRRQETHTPDKTPYRESLDNPLWALLGKFPLWKTEVSQASRVHPLRSACTPPHPTPSPRWKFYFSGKGYF